jgi:hypothetical protein
MSARLARVVFGLALTAPGVALAQPPPRPAVIEPVQTGAVAPPSSWRFSLSADGSWYENARFVGPVLENSAWSTHGQASLTHERRFRDGKFDISAFGGAIYYPEIDALNQPTYGGALGLNWSPSRRSRFTVDLSYEQTNTRYLEPVDVEGLPLPTSLADYIRAKLGWEQQLSRFWLLAVEGSYLNRSYDDPLLLDSDQVYGTLSLGHQLGRRGLFYFGYVYSSAWFELGKERSHQALVGGRHSVERGLGFELAGGVGYVESTESFYPAGRAGLYAVGRKTRLDLVYYRDFGQAYGYGRQMIGDMASATFSWTAVRRLTFNAAYNYSYRRDPSEETYSIESGVASAGFGWDIGGGFAFSGHYAWERNETAGFPAFEGGSVHATLTYGVSWH